MEEKVTKCSVSKKCGSCQYQGVPYKEQLAAKQKRMKKLLGKFANVKPIIGMDDPFYYRNKVHAVFDRDKKGNIICGTYEAKTHKVVPIEECMIEDKISPADVQDPQVHLGSLLHVTKKKPRVSATINIIKLFIE